MLTERQLRRNALMHVLDGVFFFGAVALFSREVVMPAMVRDLSESNLLIGLIPAVFWGGVVLPQAFLAKKVESLAHKKRVMLLCVGLQRAGWLALLAMLPVLWGTPSLLVVFFTALGISSLGSGAVTPVWNDWFAKTTPQQWWGRILGLRLSAFGVLALALGPVMSRVMDAYEPPRRYQILLALSLGAYALSAASLLFIREAAEEAPSDTARISWQQYRRRLAKILFKRRDYRRFVAANLLIVVPMLLLSSFLTKYGLGLSGVSERATGTFTLAFYAAMAAGSLLAGRMSDRQHVLAPFRLLPAALFAAAVAALLARTTTAVAVAFAFLGFALGAHMAVCGPAVWRYAGKSRRPSYAAVFASVMGLSSAVVPMLAGILLDAGLVTYAALFAACAVLSAAAWAAFRPMKAPAVEGETEPIN